MNLTGWNRMTPDFCGETAILESPEMRPGMCRKGSNVSSRRKSSRIAAMPHVFGQLSGIRSAASAAWGQSPPESGGEACRLSACFQQLTRPDPPAYS
jgi:hypothetical protein